VSLTGLHPVNPSRPGRPSDEDGEVRNIRTIDLDDRRFRVFSSERVSAGREFLLVHGVGISHRLFSRLHGVLSAEHSVHTLDLPGFGGLPKPASDPDVEAMAADLGRVLDRLQIGPVVAIGDSMGTQWVVELAAQRPDLVSHVVAIGPVADSRHRSLLEQATALGLDSLREPPSANARVLVEYARCGPRWYAQQVRHMLDYPIEKRVSELSVPLLVLRGGRDPIAGPEWSRDVARRTARGRFVQVAGHPHLVQHTAPEPVAREIEAFLEAEPM